MTLKRTFLALIAFTLLLPLSGCGCRRNCNSSGSFAPPPAPCCPPVGGAAFGPGPRP
jgi:hypothetical protein